MVGAYTLDTYFYQIIPEHNEAEKLWYCQYLLYI